MRTFVSRWLGKSERFWDRVLGARTHERDRAKARFAFTQLEDRSVPGSILENTSQFALPESPENTLNFVEDAGFLPRFASYLDTAVSDAKDDQKAVKPVERLFSSADNTERKWDIDDPLDSLPLSAGSQLVVLNPIDNESFELSLSSSGNTSTWDGPIDPLSESSGNSSVASQGMTPDEEDSSQASNSLLNVTPTASSSITIQDRTTIKRPNFGEPVDFKDARRPILAGRLTSRVQSILNPNASTDSNATMTQQLRSQVFDSTLGRNSRLDSRRDSMPLGQTLQFSKGSSLVGLRTSSQSSGPAQLVGTHSVSDLMKKGGNGTNIEKSVGSISNDVPGNDFPWIKSQAFTVTTADSDASVSSILESEGNISELQYSELDQNVESTSDISLIEDIVDTDPELQWTGSLPDISTLTQDTGAFILTESGEDANGPYILQETGTVTFPANWDTSSSTYPLSVAYDYILHRGPGPLDPANDQQGSVIWSGNAVPTGLLAGFDIDQDNLTRLGIDRSTSTNYLLEFIGKDSFVSNDTTNPIETNNGITISHNYNNLIGCKGAFRMRAEKLGGGIRIIWDNTSDAKFSNHDHGTEIDPITTEHPDTFTDSFVENSSGSFVEIEHIEGNLLSDGKFELISFTTDQIIQSNFTTSVTGSSSSTVQEGTLSSTYSFSSGGSSYERLVITGTPASWNATYDNDSSANYAEQQSTSYSMSSTENGVTFSDSGNSYFEESGLFTSILQISGNGANETFNVASISNQINNDFLSKDNSNGTATSKSDKESSSDGYTTYNNATGKENLVITGSATTLSCDYLNNVLVGYGEGHQGAASWNVPAEGNTGSLSSYDNATGSSKIDLEVQASMANWQSESKENPPSWETKNISVGISGNASTNAGTSGNDQVVADKDSSKITFSDTSNSNSQYGYNITGAGSNLSLSASDTVNINTTSNEYYLDNWDDSQTNNGETTTIIGSEKNSIISGDTSVASVSLNGTINQEGKLSVNSGTVSIGGTGTVTESNNGTENVDFDNGELESTVNNTTMYSQSNLLTTMIGADGSLEMTADRYINGNVNLGGTQKITYDVNPSDSNSETVISDGKLSGGINGGVQQSGKLSADGQELQATPGSGKLGLNLIGNNNAKSVEIIHATPGDNVSYPVPNFALSAENRISYAKLAAADIGVVDVTVTIETSTPDFHIVNDEAKSEGKWTLNNLDYGNHVIHKMTIDGKYPFYMDSPNGSYYTAKLVITETELLNSSGNSSSITSKNITSVAISGKGDGVTNGPIYQQEGGWAKISIHEELDYSSKNNRDGSHTGSGTSTGNEKADETSISKFSAFLEYDDGFGSTLRVTRDEVKDYHQNTNLLAGNHQDLVEITSSYTYLERIIGHYKNATTTEDSIAVEEYRLTEEIGENDSVVTHPYWNRSLSGTLKDNETGQIIQSWDSNTPTSPPPGSRDWFANLSDFSAGMGDTISCGLTARIREGLGYDDAVNKDGTGYFAGQIAGTAVDLALTPVNPCGKARWAAGAIRGLSVAQGTGHALNAGEAAASGDFVGAGMSLMGARASFAKYGKACFAAGTRLLTPEGSKAIEEFVPGDFVLSRDEHDASGEVAPKVVEEVFRTTGRILHLHVGGEVIRTTAQHPFYAHEKGWIEAELLQQNDWLLGADGHWRVVEEVFDIGEEEVVYNLRVADWHTYFVVGREGWSVWAHNQCTPVQQLGQSDKGARVSLRRSTGSKANHQAHHVVPWNLRQEPGVRYAAQGGFQMNRASNGILLPKNRAAGGGAVHSGSHPKYEDAIRNKIRQLHATSSSPSDMATKLQAYINQLQRGLGRSSGTLH